MDFVYNNDLTNCLLRLKDIIYRTPQLSFLKRTNVSTHESQKNRQRQRTIQQMKLFFTWLGRTIFKTLIENKYGLRMKKIQFEPISRDELDQEHSQIDIEI